MSFSIIVITVFDWLSFMHPLICQYNIDSILYTMSFEDLEFPPPFSSLEKCYKTDAYNGGECVSFDILTCANKK